MSTGSIRQRWGLFGGTFDPPHLGHLAAAREVRDRLGLDQVVLMVAGEPWQKTQVRHDLTPAPIRLEMVRALVEGEPGLVAGDDEIQRGGPTYTVDTLRAWRDVSPNVDVYLVLGADAASRLDTWREPAEVLSLSTLVVVSRPGSVRPHLPSGATVEWIEMEPVEVSSTGIRAGIASGHAPEGTTAEVARVIERHRLYRGEQ